MDFDILMCPFTTWGLYNIKTGDNICTDKHMEFDLISERFVHKQTQEYIYQGKNKF